MATTLDRLLAVVSANNGDGLHIVQDEPARLRKGQAEHALTKQPLTAAQLVALLREAAPAEAARVERGESAAFSYSYGDGVFDANAHYASGRLTVAITPRGATPAVGARATPRSTPVAGARPRAPNGTPPHPSGTRQGATGDQPVVASRPMSHAPSGGGVVVTDGGDHRRRLEALLRLQCDRGASDLHLRSGSPPLLRVNGDVVPVEQH
ncbi:MAG TPA: hypothetical protein VF178_16815, partial [Gemmatimonadaceae bacterium]